MKDIKCPSCGKNFRIDPSGFEEILHQIKDEEFKRQLNERLQLAEEDKRKEIEIAKNDLRIQLLEESQKKESIIQALESKLNSAEDQKSNALNELKLNKVIWLVSASNPLKKTEDLLDFHERFLSAKEIAISDDFFVSDFEKIYETK